MQQLGFWCTVAPSFQKLDLSDEQKNSLKELRSGDKETHKALREKAKAARKKMAEAFKNDASESILRSSYSDLKSIRSQLADSRFEKKLAIRKILTTEQRKKFNKMQGKMHVKGRKGHRGHKSGRMHEEEDDG